MELINYLMSPLKDEGIDFIWFAKYKDNSFKYEYDESKNKTDFDSVYHDKDKIKEFGLIGEGKRISFLTENGLFGYTDENGNNENDIQFELSTENGTIQITDNPGAVYSDFTTKRYIHTTDTSLDLEVDVTVVGYTTNVECGKSKIKVEILYFVYDNRDEMKVSLTSDNDLKGELSFKILDTIFSGTIKAELKKNKKSEFTLRIQNEENITIG